MVVERAVAKTIKFCKACDRETPHGIFQCDSNVVRICTACLERTRTYEQDRE